MELSAVCANVCWHSRDLFSNKAFLSSLPFWGSIRYDHLLTAAALLLLLLLLLQVLGTWSDEGTFTTELTRAGKSCFALLTLLTPADVIVKSAPVQQC
jgi:hypothetical protein